MTIRIFIFGEVRLHRDGLALQLARFSHLDIVGVGDLNDALEILRTEPVDCLILDPVPAEGAALVEKLRTRRRGLHIIALGIREVESEVLACAAAGIDGYVAIDADVDSVVTAVESVMRGELVCSPKVAASLYHSVASLVGNDMAALTHRELEVVELMNGGLSNKEISRRLNIETCTAKNHVQTIMQKLGVHRRGQAAAKVRQAIGQRFA